MDARERLLVFLLRAAGAVMTLAFGAVLLPESSMAAIYGWLGLGDYPVGLPLIDYLNRSISLLYGIHGGLFLVASSNVRAFAPIIRYLMWMNVVFGVVMIVVDLRAGMPWWWTLLEGPMIMGFAFLNLYLLRSVPAEG